MELRIQKLSNSHKKSDFDSERPLLDNYIRNQAKQDVTRDLSACYVLVDSSQKVIGYYTLSSNSISKVGFPEDLLKKLPPSYTALPTVLLGRLAVDKGHKRRGYGTLLLTDALNRCVALSEDLGILAVVVDPVDDAAVQFYNSFGFILLPSTRKMFIPIKTIQASMP